jgi:hypothetical protein
VEDTENKAAQRHRPRLGWRNEKLLAKATQVHERVGMEAHIPKFSIRDMDWLITIRE